MDMSKITYSCQLCGADITAIMEAVPWDAEVHGIECPNEDCPMTSTIQRFPENAATD
jgi:hypothetical protein